MSGLGRLFRLQWIVIQSAIGAAICGLGFGLGRFLLVEPIPKVALSNVNDVSTSIIVRHQVDLTLTPFARLDLLWRTFPGHADLTEGRLLDRQRYDGVFDL
jgi:hypothetical protein